jgi:hypothetical protein
MNAIDDLTPVPERDLPPERFAELASRLLRDIEREQRRSSRGRRRARVAAMVLIPAAVLAAAGAYALNGTRTAPQVADEVTCYQAADVNAPAAGVPSQSGTSLAAMCRTAWTSGSIHWPVPGAAPASWVACTGHAGGVDVFPGTDVNLCRRLGLQPLPPGYRDAVASFRSLASAVSTRFADGTCVVEGPAARAARRILDAHGYGDWAIHAKGFSSAAPCALADLDPVNGVLTLNGWIRPKLERAAEAALDADACGPQAALLARVQDSVDAAGFPQWRVTVDHELSPNWPCVAGFNPDPGSLKIVLAGHASRP